jgi:hypothetical protein
MRLSELNPRWFSLEPNGPKVGLTFDCPHCRTQRLGVSFHESGKEAIQDAYIHAHSPTTDHIWTRSGDDFEILSLSPSVDASASGHWHGFVAAGNVQ